jgi:hypothetical protein
MEEAQMKGTPLDTVWRAKLPQAVMVLAGLVTAAAGAIAGETVGRWTRTAPAGGATNSCNWKRRRCRIVLR